ncbi:MAG: glutamate--tRNA ligase [Acidobacteria bacterium]|nr:glutamate--tRNA ligase [Acidobacteriota bacterium]
MSSEQQVDPTSPTRPVRVRFAPSPTGYLHVGGARTALFNWLFARKTGGRLILRIEDTDLERSSETMVTGILDGLEWLGLGWDEGPYFQSERLTRYSEVAARLIERGEAYPCFCAPGELASRRAEATDRKQTWKYEGICRSLPRAEAAARLASAEPAAIRFKVPASGSLTFTDHIFSRITTGYEQIEDFVLLRSDGHPTYHLSVVVDDIDMGITHVIRGADHLPNTPKQILLYRALEQQSPIFAHVPLILGRDKSRLSKRHGATSVTAYREMGFLPEAFRNFLALLGWSPGNTDQEIFGAGELIEAFSLEGISRSNAVFNLEKAMWMNAQYMARSPTAVLSRELEPWLRERGLWEPEFAAEGAARLHAVVDLLKSRARSLADLASAARPYLSPSFELEPAAVEKNLRRHEQLKVLIPELADRLAGLSSFDLTTTEAALRELADERGVKAGLLINAARTALTGSGATPGIFDVMVCIGKPEVVRRLRDAVRLIA